MPISGDVFKMSVETMRPESMMARITEVGARRAEVAACAFTTMERSTQGSYYYQIFATGSDCRSALNCSASSTQVIIFDLNTDVSSINLAAALCKDDPDRDVYLQVEQPSGSLSSRAMAAGIRGIINLDQAELMLALADTVTETGTTATASSIDDDIDIDDVLEGLPVGEELPAVPVTAVSAVQGQFAEGAVNQTQWPENPSMQVKRAEANNPRELQLHAFVSGRGGVGKSTVSLLLGLLAQSRGMRVVLLDLDLQFGDLEYMVGQSKRNDLIRISLEQLLSDQRFPSLDKSSMLLVTAPHRVEQAESIASQLGALPKLLLNEADIVLVNTGAIWTEIQAVLAQYSSSLMFMMDQRATSIQGCRQAVDLCVRMGIPSTRFKFLLNRCSKTSPLSVQDVSLALAGAEVSHLAEGGAIVDELLALGAPHELMTSHNPFLESLTLLLDDLLDSRSKFTSSSLVRSSDWIQDMPVLQGIRKLLEGGRHVTS